MDDSQAPKSLTFGERAVGLSFNPGKNPEVENIKRKAASLIDALHDYRSATEDGEVKAQLTIAIREIQTGQMWGVKAVTWNL